MNSVGHRAGPAAAAGPAAGSIVSGVNRRRIGVIVDVLLPIGIMVGVSLRLPDAWPWALVGGSAMAAALGLRHRRPFLALWLATFTQAGLLWLDAPALGAIGVGVTLYTVSSRAPWWRAFPASIASIAVLVGAEIISSRYLGIAQPNLVAVVLLFTVGIASGVAVANYRAYTAAADARAADAEQRSLAEMNQHIAEERLALARDLHDSIGHHLAVANIQTGVAKTKLSSDTATSQQALDHAASATQAAMTELSQLVAALRERTSQPLAAGGPSPRSHRLDDLDLDDVDVTGADIVDDLPPQVVDACFRVIQEGVTNARKHAQGRAISLTVTRSVTAVCLRIDNDLPTEATAASPTGGFGLTGLAERLHAVGGTVTAGPDRGRFVLTATIPLTRGCND